MRPGRTRHCIEQARMNIGDILEDIDQIPVTSYEEFEESLYGEFDVVRSLAALIYASGGTLGGNPDYVSQVGLGFQVRRNTRFEAISESWHGKDYNPRERVKLATITNSTGRRSQELGLVVRADASTSGNYHDLDCTFTRTGGTIVTSIPAKFRLPTLLSGGVDQQDRCTIEAGDNSNSSQAELEMNRFKGNFLILASLLLEASDTPSKSLTTLISS